MQTTLGLSNISFGLNPAARQVLNSVFLHECQEAGLDSAIVHASKIVPMNRIDEKQREVALDLVYDRRREGYDPLQELMGMFEGVSAASSKESRAAELAKLPLLERLAQRIVDGERNGLDADLDEAMTQKPPLAIINENLLAGMKTVGELFGSGQMQLPFVLQSAEVMKAAVAYLEPHMEKADDDAGKGRIVLATVKGDVHDIGKNLVDIILTNNGYEVVNIGIKQPINTILEVAEDKSADVVGMSGLLVKSTVVMKENLEEMNTRGVSDKFPVLLGGAALTRSYVENDLAEIYEGEVHYARDAFEGLRADGHHHERQTWRGAATPTARRRSLRRRRKPSVRPGTSGRNALPPNARRRRHRSRCRSARTSPPTSMCPSRRSGGPASSRALRSPTTPDCSTSVRCSSANGDCAAYAAAKARPTRNWWRPKAGRGCGTGWTGCPPTASSRMPRWSTDTSRRCRMATMSSCYPSPLVLGRSTSFAPQDARERFRFTFPRQQRGRFLCIADFIRSKERAAELGQVDVLPFQLVTMGQPIADFANELFASDSYRDYLEVHGIGVQLTEALAEYWHRRVREELKFPDHAMAAEDPDSVEDYFKLGYRGARFSFGYGACPNLDDRTKMVELLEPGRIGVTLSEELQLHPEQSTDAFVLHHPEAKYFNVFELDRGL